MVSVIACVLFCCIASYCLISSFIRERKKAVLQMQREIKQIQMYEVIIQEIKKEGV